MLNRWLAGWPLWRSREDRRAAAVYLSPRGVAAAVGARSGDRYAVDLRAMSVRQPAEVTEALREVGRSVGLADAGCNLVLAPEFYSLSLVDRPPVPDDELKEAVRWRLQENLDFPPDQAAIDVFPLPESASRERSMVFVVALQQESLKRHLDRVHGAGIRVSSVDVAELAMRNVACGLYPEPDSCVGMLRLTAGSGVVNVSRGEDLFLSRRISGIPAQLSESAWTEFQDRLLLQVQRSIDYFESAMGQPPCNALIVATSHDWQDRVCEYLDDMLPVSVRTIENELRNLYDLRLCEAQPVALNWDAPGPGQHDLLTWTLPALGGVLRPFLGVPAVEHAA